MANSIDELKREIAELENQLANRKQALALLTSPIVMGVRKGTMSAKGKAAVAKAQRARWAKIRADKKKA